MPPDNCQGNYMDKKEDLFLDLFPLSHRPSKLTAFGFALVSLSP